MAGPLWVFEAFSCREVTVAEKGRCSAAAATADEQIFGSTDEAAPRREVRWPLLLNKSVMTCLPMDCAGPSEGRAQIGSGT